MPVIVESVLLVVAGVVAGAIGAAGGITSLVSYSVLLAIGLPPLPATAANLVAAVAAGPGSALTSRRELTAIRHALAPMLAVAAVSAAAGSVLLLATPPGVFARIVPFLIALASCALLLQPRLTRRAGPAPERPRASTWLLLGLVWVYAGYFGAGSGVLLLAVLLVLVDDRLPEANAAKNVLLGVTALVSAVVLVLGGPVPWAAVVPLAVGLLGGSAIGPLLVRRLPARFVRWAVAGFGLVLAVVLWTRQA